MADISMCLDHECPSKVHCYRYRAKPNQYHQSYMDTGRDKKAQKCDKYSTTAGWSDFSLVPMSALKPTTKGDHETNQG
jgi:hypothetical protein